MLHSNKVISCFRGSGLPTLDRLLSFAALFLLDVEHPLAAWTIVVRILEAVHEEGDEAAAQHQPAAQQPTF